MMARAKALSRKSPTDLRTLKMWPILGRVVEVSAKEEAKVGSPELCGTRSTDPAYRTLGAS